MRKTFVFKPHKSLAPFIEAYVICYSDDSNKKDCFFPSNLPILCFDLNKKHFKELGSKNNFNFSLGLSGVMDRCIFLEEIPKKSMQVVFKPYGAFKLFKIPMHHFVNNAIDIKCILPNLAGCIHQLEDAYQNDQDSIKILESFLLKQLKFSNNECSYFDRIQFACETIKNSQSAVKISSICHKVSMSETQFRLHFKEKVGISPKKFSQIETFQQINRYLQRNPDADWMDVVVKFSFFDQTHFINNFKWFFSCTPTEFLKNQGNSKSKRKFDLSSK